MTHQGVRVLELGCGCGLVGLCFAACGADVLLTDLPETMVSGAGQRQQVAVDCTPVWGKSSFTQFAPGMPPCDL